jgi:hypothetical protein
MWRAFDMYTSSIRQVGVLAAVIVAIVVLMGTVGRLGGQPRIPGESRPTATAGARTLPRTKEGRPDLQGVWNYSTITPLERPAELAGKAFLTEAEAAALAKREADHRSRANPVDLAEAKQVPDFGAGFEAPLAYEFRIWWDRGTVAKTRQTSLVIDPPDGRIPPLTPEGQKQRAADMAYRRQHPSDGPEDRSVVDRCIFGINEGPPMIPNTYNNHVQIFQAPGYVALLTEMNHNARIVPMEEPPRPPVTVRQWAGHSRGHWDGDTLVVDSVNFRAATGYWASSANMRLRERFTRVDAGTLIYTFTVEDPTTWTRPFTAQVPMTRTDERILEYACHEGNYSMANILAGARAEERAAATAAGRVPQ